MCKCSSEGNGLVVLVGSVGFGVGLDDLKGLFQPKNDSVILWIQNCLLPGWEGRLKATQQGRDKSENSVRKCCPESDLTTRGRIPSSLMLKSRTEPWTCSTNHQHYTPHLKNARSKQWTRENLCSKMIPFSIRRMHTNLYQEPDPHIADSILLCWKTHCGVSLLIFLNGI